MAKGDMRFQLLEKIRDRQQAIASATLDLKMSVGELRTEMKELGSAVSELVIEVDKLRKVVFK